MMKTLISFSLFLVSFSLFAQMPEFIEVQKLEPSATRANCDNPFAGTVTIQNRIGFSNDWQSEPIFLCANDQLDIRGNRDARFSDPIPSTPPGISYAFYRCQPTISGPPLSAIATDPCIYADVINNRIRVTAARSINPEGDIIFFNTGFLQTNFNNGNPVRLWFAPITVDNFANNDFEENLPDWQQGLCAHVNVDAAFSVVYLNPIQIDDIQTPNATALNGSFTITGGLPQFDNSNYMSITIVNVDNSAIVGQVTTPGNITHGSRVDFTVPQAGNYRISITDGKACPAELILSMPRSAINLCVNPMERDAALGEDFCLEITMSNVNDLLSFQFPISWDPSILEYTGYTIPSPSVFPGFTDFNINLSSTGTFNIVWFNDTGVTFDEAVVINICFRAIGLPGSSSPVNLMSIPLVMDVEFTNSSGETIPVNSKAGSVNIIPPTNVQIITRSCDGNGGDGSISFAIFGDDGPFNVDIEYPDGSTQTFNNVPAGVFTDIFNLAVGAYAITAMSVSGGVGFIIVSIAGVPRLEVSNIPSGNPRCHSDRNGFAEAVINRVPPFTDYSFQWNTGNVGVNRISSLGNGTYTVTVTDRTGCSATGSVTLFKSPLEVMLAPLDPPCDGVPNGRILATASGSNPPNPGQDYRFDWSNNVFDRAEITGLAAGTYTVTVTDRLQCQATAQVTLVTTKQIDLDITVVQPGCVNPNGGSITATITETGGTPANYTFIWSPMGSGMVNSQPRSSILSDLSPGTYSVIARNADGCEVTSGPIVLNDPSTFNVIRQTGVAADCNDENSLGSVTLLSTPPGNYTYQWETGATGNFLQARPGVYTVTVTDINTGCIRIDSFLIGPIVVFDIEPESCEGNLDGSINATIVFDDSFTVTVQWSTGATGNSISNLAAGEYSITITGTSEFVVGNCVLVQTITVPIAPRFTITTDNINPTCPGDNDGIIRVNVVGGQGPFSYRWEHTSSTSNILTGQRAGTYFVNISDDSGCTPLRFEVVLTQPNLIMFSFAQIQGVSCSNTDCDGSAVLSLSGGSAPGQPFIVAWGNNAIPNVTGPILLDNLCFGNNRVDVTDANGCAAFSNVPIPGPDPIALNESLSEIEDVSCFGNSDGRIAAVASGGNGVFTYRWPSLNIDGPTITGLAPGLYVVEVTDGNGCTATLSIQINEPNPLVATIDPANSQSVGCSGNNDGQITVIVAGGNTGTRIFSWDPNVSNTNVATGLSPGLYTVTVTDRRGCSDEVSYEVLEAQPIIAVIPQPEEPRCSGLETLVSVTSATGGGGAPYNYTVNNGPLIPVGTPFSVPAGNIDISVFDARGCRLDTSFVVSEPPAILVNLGGDISIDLGDTLTLQPFITPLSGTYSYNWSPGTDISCTNCREPQVFPISTATYRLAVTDENGCTAFDQITITVLKRRLVYIPNAFTPNNDNINDVFQVFTGRGVRALNHMRIYDRWGNVMFEIEALNFDDSGSAGWNGESKGRMVDPGVYIYTVEVEFIDDTTLTYRGEVTVFR